MLYAQLVILHFIKGQAVLRIKTFAAENVILNTKEEIR